MANEWENCENSVQESAKIATTVGAIAGGAAGLYVSVRLPPAAMLSKGLAVSSGITIGAGYGFSGAPAGTIEIAPVAAEKLMTASGSDITSGILATAAGGIASYMYPKVANFAGLTILGAQLGSSLAPLAVSKAGMLYCDSRYEKPERPEGLSLSDILKNGKKLEKLEGVPLTKSLWDFEKLLDCKKPTTENERLACASVNGQDISVPPHATASAPAKAASAIEGK